MIIIWPSSRTYLEEPPPVHRSSSQYPQGFGKHVVSRLIHFPTTSSSQHDIPPPNAKASHPPSCLPDRT
jgi:hypothetical protein